MLEAIQHFFVGFTWEQLIAGIFFILFGLAPGFNIFQGIKNVFKLEGKSAQAMVMGVSMIITALAMLVTDSLGIESLQFNLGSILAFSGMLYKASQMAYQAFKDAMAPPFSPDDLGF